MYAIVETGIYAKSGERLYLTEYVTKERLATYSTDRRKARMWVDREEAEDFNNSMPKTINGTIINVNFN